MSVLLDEEHCLVDQVWAPIVVATGPEFQPLGQCSDGIKDMVDPLRGEEIIIVLVQHQDVGMAEP